MLELPPQAHNNIGIFVHITGMWETLHPPQIPPVISAAWRSAALQQLCDIAILRDGAREVAHEAEEEGFGLGWRRVLARLESEIHNGCTNYDGILLLGHGLGGIVAKGVAALIHAQTPQTLLGLITLASPHGTDRPALRRLLAASHIDKHLVDDVASGVTLINRTWTTYRENIAHEFFYGTNDALLTSKLAIDPDDERSCHPVGQDRHSIVLSSSTTDDIVSRLAEVALALLQTPPIATLSDRQLEELAQRMLRGLRLQPFAFEDTSASGMEIVTQTAKCQDPDAVINLLGTAGSDQLVLCTNLKLDPTVENKYWRAAGRAGKRLRIWDVSTIRAALRQDPKIGFALDQSTYAPKSLPPERPSVTFSAPTIRYLADKFGDRKQDVADCKTTILSPEIPLFQIVGLPGVGKTWLATYVADKLAQEFEAVLTFSFTADTRDLDFINTLNDFFVENGELDFDHVATNSKIAPEERVEVAYACCRRSRFLFLLDNVEPILDRRSRIRLTFIRKFLLRLCALTDSTKIILTSRRHVSLPGYSPSGAVRHIDPFDAGVLEFEMLDKYANLKSAAKNDREQVVAELHRLSGGVPLILDLMNQFLKDRTLSDIKGDIYEAVRERIVSALLRRCDPDSRESIECLAVFNDAVSIDFLRSFRLNNNQINRLVSVGLLGLDYTSDSYAVHPWIAEKIRATLLGKTKIAYHQRIAQYLVDCQSLGHRDSYEAHMLARKQLHHTILAGNMNDAAEILGRVCSRALSLNNIEEIKAHYERLTASVSSDAATAWLLNVSGHLLDFRRDFKRSENVYRDMLSYAKASGDLELIAIATSNYGTTFRRNGDFEKALRYYFSAYRIASKGNFKKVAGSALNNIGQTYAYMAGYPIAAKTLRGAMKLRESQGDHYRLAATQTHYGNLCLNIAENWDSLTPIDREKLGGSPEKWLAQGQESLQRSIDSQHEQRNSWLLDRSYRAMAKYWKSLGREEKVAEFESLAATNEGLRDPVTSPLFH